jgi:hypothetical protein
MAQTVEASCARAIRHHEESAYRHAHAQIMHQHAKWGPLVGLQGGALPPAVTKALWTAYPDAVGRYHSRVWFTFAEAAVAGRAIRKGVSGFKVTLRTLHGRSITKKYFNQEQLLPPIDARSPSAAAFLDPLDKLQLQTCAPHKTVSMSRALALCLTTQHPRVAAVIAADVQAPIVFITSKTVDALGLVEPPPHRAFMVATSGALRADFLTLYLWADVLEANVDVAAAL